MSEGVAFVGAGVCRLQCGASLSRCTHLVRDSLLHHLIVLHGVIDCWHDRSWVWQVRWRRHHRAGAARASLARRRRGLGRSLLWRQHARIVQVLPQLPHSLKQRRELGEARLQTCHLLREGRYGIRDSLVAHPIL